MRPPFRIGIVVTMAVSSCTPGEPSLPIASPEAFLSPSPSPARLEFPTCLTDWIEPTIQQIVIDPVLAGVVQPHYRLDVRCDEKSGTLVV